MGHFRQKERTGLLINIEIDYNKLIIGKGRFPLQYPEDILCRHAPKCWMTSIAEIMKDSGGKLIVKSNRAVNLQHDSIREKLNKF